jgi:hypothetical protein
MKALLVALSAVVMLASVALPARAETEKGVFGAGLIVGEPTGLSVKYYLGDDTALDGAVGGTVFDSGLQVHGDFLWHPWILESKPSFVLPAYIGIGARFATLTGGGSSDGEIRVGPRGVLGVLFDFTEVPLDVFIEVAGTLDFKSKGDSFGFGINLGAGVRYYF